jgi:hypothetical protein
MSEKCLHQASIEYPHHTGRLRTLFNRDHAALRALGVIWLHSNDAGDSPIDRTSELATILECSSDRERDRKLEFDTLTRGFRGVAPLPQTAAFLSK